MSFPIRMILAGSITGIVAVPAMAADYLPPLTDGPVYVEQAERAVPVEVGSGWYLRGDVSYSVSTRPAGAFTYRSFDPASQSYGAGTFDSARLDPDFGYGVGVGYRFTDWIRGDITAERFALRFNGATSFAAPCPGQVQPAATNCTTADTARMNATSLMANGYVDLGTFAGFTPYVGAGVGYTIADWSALGRAYNCAPGGAACNAGSSHTGNDGISSWRFTYAAAAGVAYDVSRNMKIDLGYKWRRVAGGDMFRFDQAARNSGATGVEGRDAGFSQHEIRLGLRYELW